MIKVITTQEACNIVETRRPIGKYILREGGAWIGIDNRTGDAWTEEFPRLIECLRWLQGGV